MQEGLLEGIKGLRQVGSAREYASAAKFY